MRLKAVALAKTTGNICALQNAVFVSTQNLSADVRYVTIQTQNGSFCFNLKQRPDVTDGTIEFRTDYREWMKLPLDKDIDVTPLDPKLEHNIQSVQFDVSLAGKAAALTLSQDIVKTASTKALTNCVLQTGQLTYVQITSPDASAKMVTLKLCVMVINRRGGSNQSGDWGIFQQNSAMFLHASSDISFVGDAVSSGKTISPSFDLMALGIGGLSKEFGDIFRRAFSPRLLPPADAKKLGIQFPKGIILHGPPGTGKTLIARSIGKMLHGHEPKVVSGPEILGRYVGQSEENIRKLFEDAEAESKKSGDASKLHIIIMDEFDAICKQRGSRNDGTGVGDSVVNQLLAKMDGVNVLNNIVVIGLTNRLDMIDEALLRPGRFEIHVEISLPDARGRLEILNIHTSSIRAEKKMDPALDLNDIAANTKNFSGAELSGLIKSATTFALGRCTKVVENETTLDSSKFLLKRDDFTEALLEVKPAFGSSDEDIGRLLPHGIIRFGDHVDTMINQIRLHTTQVKESTSKRLMSLLLHGNPGCGKTALAAYLATTVDFPFIKIISPDNLAGYSESQRNDAISKTFNDAYRSAQSVIIVDNIERLLDWVPIGPRFSNTTLQTLFVYFMKTPPKDHRLLILATSSLKDTLDLMTLTKVFDASIEIKNVTEPAEVAEILKTKKGDTFTEARISSIEASLREKSSPGSNSSSSSVRFSLGVKKVLDIIDLTTRNTEDPVALFLSAVESAGGFAAFAGADGRGISFLPGENNFYTPFGGARLN